MTRAEQLLALIEELTARVEHLEKHAIESPRNITVCDTCYKIKHP